MSELDNRNVDSKVESADQLKMRVDQLTAIVSELQVTNDELRAKLKGQNTPDAAPT